MEDKHRIQYWESKKELKRAFIFWDHANVFHNLQEIRVRIDYELAKRRLAQGYYLVAPIMYLGTPDIIFPKKEKFFAALERTGWSITKKPLRTDRSGKLAQYGVDEVMFQHICEFAKEGAYEKAIIVSGDNIFVKVVRKLKDLDIKVDVWSFRKSLSRALIWEVGRDNVFYLDNILDEIRLKDEKL